MKKSEIKVRKNPSKRTRNKKKKIPVYILLAPFLVIFLIVFLYIVLVMPARLSFKIKSDIVGIFNPLDVSEEADFIIVKLRTTPDEKTQDYFIEKIASSYNLNPGFEKISSDETLPVYKINFYKGSAEYKSVKEIYIFWKNLPENKEDVITNINQSIKIEKTEKEIVKEQKETVLKKNISERTFVKKITVKEKKIDNPVIKKRETPDDENYAKVIIVLDDVGYDYKTTYDYFALDFPITFSIIPGMTDSKKFYEMIKKRRFDFILHIPMEPEKGSIYVEKNAILVNMSDREIGDRIRGFVEEYPEAIGANNHMGSKAVSDRRVMDNVIGELSKKNMFWLDSMTTLNTTAESAADEFNVRYFRRNVFLDNEDSYEAIKRSMERLVNEAKIRGSAIGIGHIQSGILLRVLKEFYDNRNDLKIKFVNLNDL